MFRLCQAVDDCSFPAAISAWDVLEDRKRLAEKADLNIRTLQSVEAGKLNILVTTAARIQRALGCDWHKLMPPQMPCGRYCGPLKTGVAVLFGDENNGNGISTLKCLLHFFGEKTCWPFVCHHARIASGLKATKSCFTSEFRIETARRRPMIVLSVSAAFTRKFIRSLWL